MEKCDFCFRRYDCIGEFPGPDGVCLGFGVSPELAEDYFSYLEEKKIDDFAALCRGDFSPQND